MASMVKLRSPVPAGAAKQRQVSRILIAALLNHPHIFEDVEEELGSVSSADSDLERLKHESLGFLSSQGDEFIIAEPQQKRQILHDHLRASGYAKEIDDILCTAVYTHAGFCAPHAQPETITAKWLEFWRGSNAEMLMSLIHI